jgi:peptidoglycan hydrolase-like protein with peptidoglycan-binding domain
MKANQPITVEIIQAMLQAQRFYHGKIDNDWGSQTQAAMDSFQRKQGAAPPPWLVVGRARTWRARNTRPASDAQNHRIRRAHHAQSNERRNPMVQLIRKLLYRQSGPRQMTCPRTR